MAPIVEAFKWGTLGNTGPFPTVPAVTCVSLILVTMLTGMWFFYREEAASVDEL